MLRLQAASTLRSSAHSRRRRRAGVTVIEVIITLTIFLVVVSIFSRMVIATSGLKRQNRENAIAAEAARVLLEDMRNADFRDVFALYNEDPGDDPGGAGTAPGHRFPVLGLTAREEAPDGLVGQVYFPAAWLPAPVDEAAAEEAGLPPPEPEITLQLREDHVDASLGMPRDLSGDSIIDARDHADDYILIPIRVRIEWKGTNGPCELEIFTMLGSYVL